MFVVRSALLSSRFLLVLAAGLTAVRAHAQSTEAPSAPATDAVALTPVVVSASRTPQDPRYVSSSVSVLDLPEFVSLQVPSLAEALATVPGVFVNRTGAVGGQASVFIRGAASHQTLFLVDGVRINDRSSPYFNSLGGASLGGLDRLEVLRGPQSTLYGSNAVGGIILLDTTRGCGPTTGKLSTLIGSDQTWGAGVSASGGTNKLGYSAHVDHYATDNARPWNAFAQTSGSTRIEFAANDWLLVGATARVAESRSEEPGSRVWPTQAVVRNTDHLATTYARIHSGDWLVSRLTLAQHQRHYLYSESWGESNLRNQRRILDWQNTVTFSELFEITAGTNFETSRYRINSAAQADRVEAGFVSATYRPLRALVLTGGLRYDDYQTFSSATTGRLGATWLLNATTKVRSTFGTGFIAPGTDDRFGVAAWGQLASPDLRPEKSRGWDFGVDHTFAHAPVTVSATYFQNRLRDLFEWQYVNFVTYEGRIVNRARAETSGLELAADLKLAAAWRLHTRYTYLDARDGDTQARLTRRPRHVVDQSLIFAPGGGWEMGLGAHLVAARFENGSPLPSLLTCRAFASYAVTPQCKVQARVENALDRSYEEVSGYPALPRQVFAGLEWTF